MPRPADYTPDSTPGPVPESGPAPVPMEPPPAEGGATGTGRDGDVTARAYALGWHAGVAAGTWHDRISDVGAALRCLRLSDDGDPEWETRFGYTGPAPLSGQIPDAPTTASLTADLGLDPDGPDGPNGPDGPDGGPGLVDAIEVGYRLGFAEGYRDHVCGAAMCVVAVAVYERLTADASIGRRERDIAATYVEQVTLQEAQQSPGRRDQLARRLAILLPGATLHRD